MIINHDGEIRLGSLTVTGREKSKALDRGLARALNQTQASQLASRCRTEKQHGASYPLKQKVKNNCIGGGKQIVLYLDKIKDILVFYRYV